MQKYVVLPKDPNDPKGSKKKNNKGPIGDLSPESKGIETFEAFRRTTLTKTHRFKDKKHAEDMQAMRCTTNGQPIAQSFLDGLRPRNAAEMADEEIRFAPIGVVSNRERAAFNAAQALEYARFHSRVLVRWKLELRGAERLSSTMLDTLYAEEPSLWGYFVHGGQAAASRLCAWACLLCWACTANLCASWQVHAW